MSVYSGLEAFFWFRNDVLRDPGWSEPIDIIFRDKYGTLLIAAIRRSFNSSSPKIENDGDTGDKKTGR